MNKSVESQEWMPALGLARRLMWQGVRIPGSEAVREKARKEEAHLGKPTRRDKIWGFLAVVGSH